MNISWILFRGFPWPVSCWWCRILLRNHLSGGKMINWEFVMSKLYTTVFHQWVHSLAVSDDTLCFSLHLPHLPLWWTCPPSHHFPLLHLFYLLASLHSELLLCIVAKKMQSVRICPFCCTRQKVESNRKIFWIISLRGILSAFNIVSVICVGLLVVSWEACKKDEHCAETTAGPLCACNHTQKHTRLSTHWCFPHTLFLQITLWLINS